MNHKLIMWENLDWSFFGSGYGLAADSCGTLGNELSGAINGY
jgi:hypothetical protein